MYMDKYVKKADSALPALSHRKHGYHLRKWIGATIRMFGA